jgi:iron complex transport system substrate-binding protein
MKKIIGTFYVLLVALILAACSSNTVQKTVTDREGNEVVIKSNLERIISTAPSNTEVLIGLGLANQLVAVDNYSPIEELKEDVLIVDFRNPDAEAILSTNPDIIIASGHNRSGSDDPYVLFKEAGIPVIYIPSATSVEEIYNDIEFLASLTETTSKGEALIQEMKAEIESIKAIANSIAEKKNVYFEIGAAPSIYTMGAGTFQNDLLTIIGANNVFGDENGWIAASAESVVERNPEVILTNVNYIEDPIGELLTREGFQGVTAIINQQVYEIDNDLSNRPSHKVVEAIKEMARAVYPEYYE